MRSIKSFKKNSIIILLITAIVLYFVLKDQFGEVIKTFSNLDLRFILLAFFFFFASIVLRAYVNYKSVNDKTKLSLKEAIKHNTITQFFNGITPFSTGGQPMEIYMLTKHNIKTSHATNIIIQNFIFYQTALVICGISAVAYNAIFHLFPEVNVLKQLVFIGFLLNTLVAVILFFIAFSEKFTQKCMKIIIRILDKLKLVKNKEEAKQKWQERLSEFHKSAAELRKRKMLFIGGVLVNILGLICLYAVPLFVIYSTGDFTSLNLMDCLTASAYVMVMGAFIPIPGASGGIEYGFLKFFGNFISGSVMTTVLLIWRFITYYFGMIIGAIALNFDEKGEIK